MENKVKHWKILWCYNNWWIISR